MLPVGVQNSVLIKYYNKIKCQSVKVTSTGHCMAKIDYNYHMFLKHWTSYISKKDDMFLSNYWDPFSSPKQCYTSQEHQNKTKLVLLF